MMADRNISRRSFVKYAGLAGAACVASASLAACGQSGSQSSAASSASAASSSAAQASAASSSASAPSTVSRGKSIVVFFSRAGENYKVGYVEEGNTSIVAYSIAGKVVSSVFEIQPATPYPESYDECVEVAKKELAESARPAFVGDVQDFASYDVVYFGYPVWCERLPMIVHSFAEAHDWSGKTVVPFCTYGDSGAADTFNELKSACKGATFAEGLALQGAVAQSDSKATDEAVNAWLASVRG